MPVSKFILWGSGGHAKVLFEIIKSMGGEVVALFENRKIPSVFPDVGIFYGTDGFDNWLKLVGDVKEISGLPAIGGARGRDRLEIQRLFRENGIKVPNIFHPRAVVSNTAKFGCGNQIFANSIVAADVVVGDGCIINHKSSVDHECSIADGVHLAPGVTLCGCVTIETNVFVGAGAVILPRLKIGENAIVGAGAVVTQDVPAGSTVVGVPARPITA